MHAFLVIGEAQKYIRDLDGRKIEFPFVKIDDERELNIFLRLKLTEKTVVVLRDFDRSSEEAQNAFLKLLEEPQEDLTYVLTATNIENVLPTVQSRCQLVELGIANYELNVEEKEQISKFLEFEIGVKLDFISRISKRDEAIEFANNLIYLGHQKLINGEIDHNVLNEALNLKRNLEANGNVPLQLTNFVVNVRKII